MPYLQFIGYVYIVIQSIILGTRHEHTLKCTVLILDQIHY